jgi:hypothetical protein
LKVSLIKDPLIRCEARIELTNAKISTQISQLKREWAILESKLRKIDDLKKSISDGEEIKADLIKDLADIEVSNLDSWYKTHYKERVSEEEKNIKENTKKLKAEYKKLKMPEEDAVKLQKIRDERIEILKRRQEKYSVAAVEKLKELKTAPKKIEVVRANDFGKSLNEIIAENKQLGKLDYEAWRKERAEKLAAEIAIKKAIAEARKKEQREQIEKDKKEQVVATEQADIEQKTVPSVKTASIPINTSNNEQKSLYGQIIALKGTPKQVNWAERIRNQAIERFQQENKIDDLNHLLKKDSAAWWIINRDKFRNGFAKSIVLAEPNKQTEFDKKTEVETDIEMQ